MSNEPVYTQLAMSYGPALHLSGAGKTRGRVASHTYNGSNNKSRLSKYGFSYAPFKHVPNTNVVSSGMPTSVLPRTPVTNPEIYLDNVETYDTYTNFFYGLIHDDAARLYNQMVTADTVTIMGIVSRGSGAMNTYSTMFTAHYKEYNSGVATRSFIEIGTISNKLYVGRRHGTSTVDIDRWEETENLSNTQDTIISVRITNATNLIEIFKDGVKVHEWNSAYNQTGQLGVPLPEGRIVTVGLGNQANLGGVRRGTANEFSVYLKGLSDAEIQALADVYLPYVNREAPVESTDKWVELSNQKGRSWQNGYQRTAADHGSMCIDPNGNVLMIRGCQSYSADGQVFEFTPSGRYYALRECKAYNAFRKMMTNPKGEVWGIRGAGYQINGYYVDKKNVGESNWYREKRPDGLSISTSSSGFMSDMVFTGDVGMNIQKYGTMQLYHKDRGWLTRASSIYEFNAGYLCEDLGNEGFVFAYGNPSSDYLSRYQHYDLVDMVDRLILWIDGEGSAPTFDRTAIAMPNSEVRGNRVDGAIGFNGKLLWARYADATSPAWLCFDGETVPNFLSNPNDQIDRIISNRKDMACLFSRFGEVWITPDGINYTQLPSLSLVNRMYEPSYPPACMSDTHIYVHSFYAGLLAIKYR